MGLNMLGNWGDPRLYVKQLELRIRQGDYCQKSSTKGKDYRGTVSVTTSGRTCQAWNKQSPQQHATCTEKNRKESGLGEHNYCRNVGGNDKAVWCYTTDPKKRLEYYAVPVCTDSATGGCQKSSTKGKDYRGTVSVTTSGRTCQAWNKKSPQQHATYTEKNIKESGLGEHNYCRNVGGNDKAVWCYTTDPKKRLEYCAVPVCTDSATGGCQK